MNETKTNWGRRSHLGHGRAASRQRLAEVVAGELSHALRSRPADPDLELAHAEALAAAARTHEAAKAYRATLPYFAAIPSLRAALRLRLSLLAPEDREVRSALADDLEELGLEAAAARERHPPEGLPPRQDAAVLIAGVAHSAVSAILDLANRLGITVQESGELPPTLADDIRLLILVISRELTAERALATARQYPNIPVLALFDSQPRGDRTLPHGLGAWTPDRPLVELDRRILLALSASLGRGIPTATASAAIERGREFEVETAALRARLAEGARALEVTGARVAELSDELRRVVATKDRDIDALQGTVTDLDRALAGARRRESTLLAEHIESERTAEELVSRLAEAHQTFRRGVEELSVERGRLHQIMRERDEARERARAGDREIAAVRRELEGVHGEHQRLTSTLTADLASARDHARDLEHEVGQLREQSLLAEQRHLADARAHQERRREWAEALSARETDTEREQAQLRTALAEQHSSIAQLQLEHAETRAAIERERERAEATLATVRERANAALPALRERLETSFRIETDAIMARYNGEREAAAVALHHSELSRQTAEDLARARAAEALAVGTELAAANSTRAALASQLNVLNDQLLAKSQRRGIIAWMETSVRIGTVGASFAAALVLAVLALGVVGTGRPIAVPPSAPLPDPAIPATAPPPSTMTNQEIQSALTLADADQAPRRYPLTEYSTIDQLYSRRHERDGYRVTAKLRAPNEVVAWLGYQAEVRGWDDLTLRRERDDEDGLLRSQFDFANNVYIEILVEDFGLPSSLDVNTVAASFRLRAGGQIVRASVSPWQQPSVITGERDGGPVVEAVSLRLEFRAPTRLPLEIEFSPAGVAPARFAWTELP